MSGLQPDFRFTCCGKFLKELAALAGLLEKKNQKKDLKLKIFTTSIKCGPWVQPGAFAAAITAPTIGSFTATANPANFFVVESGAAAPARSTILQGAFA